MANAASNNRIRAELYATAEYYLCLSKVERNLTESKSGPRDEIFHSAGIRKRRA
jgi:hypothetical protein